MLFTSYPFLYVFLPITLLTVFLSAKWLKNDKFIFALLITASLIFYGYKEVSFVGILLGSICLNYVLSYLIFTRTARKTYFIAGIVLNLLILGYYKYTNFFFENVALLLGTDFVELQIILPLAISFFTFQQIAYLADVYNRKTELPVIREYLLFICFFPQLIIGPIVHHSEMMPQFARKGFAKFNASNFKIGWFFFTSGILKKVLIADNLGGYVDSVHLGVEAGQDIDFLTAWLSAVAFSLQIYFDFSGYSDMAIGLAKMINIDLPFNFDSPYKSRNVAEFWRRWHMTLSRWLRDYLYFPLGGNRHGALRTAINGMIVFLLGGLWHGAAWNFILWGALQGVGIAAANLMSKKTLRFLTPLFVLLTFIYITISWVLFRSIDLTTAAVIYQAMFSFDFGNIVVMQDISWQTLVVGLFIVFVLPNTQNVVARYKHILDRVSPSVYIPLIATVWIFLSTLGLESSAEFIYFDF